MFFKKEVVVEGLGFGFMALTVISLIILVMIIITTVGVVGCVSMIRRTSVVLDILSSGHNSFPRFNGGFNGGLPPGVSPRVPCRSECFAIMVSIGNGILGASVARVMSISDRATIRCTRGILGGNGTGKFVNGCECVTGRRFGGAHVSFLSYNQQLSSFGSFLCTDIKMTLTNLIMVFLTIFVLSNEVVEPVTRDCGGRGRFVASTKRRVGAPLAVVGTGISVLRVRLNRGGRDLRSVRRRMGHLHSLASSLIVLTHVRRSRRGVVGMNFPVSSIITRATTPFGRLTVDRKGRFIYGVRPVLSCCNGSGTVDRLATLVLSGTLGCSPSSKTVTLALVERGEVLCLSYFGAARSRVRSRRLGRIFSEFCHVSSSQGSRANKRNVNLSITGTVIATRNNGVATFAHSKHSFRVATRFPLWEGCWGPAC